MHRVVQVVLVALLIACGGSEEQEPTAQRPASPPKPKPVEFQVPSGSLRGDGPRCQRPAPAPGAPFLPLPWQHGGIERRGGGR